MDNKCLTLLGEINTLAEASPAQRLKLLEDFAGTTIHKVPFTQSLFCYRFINFICVATISQEAVYLSFIY